MIGAVGALFPGPDCFKNAVNDVSVRENGPMSPSSGAPDRQCDPRRFPASQAGTRRVSAHCHLDVMWRSCHVAASGPRSDGCAADRASFNRRRIGPAWPRRPSRRCSWPRSRDAACRTGNAACRAGDAACGAGTGHASRLGCAAHGSAAYRGAATAHRRAAHRGAAEEHGGVARWTITPCRRPRRAAARGAANLSRTRRARARPICNRRSATWRAGEYRHSECARTEPGAGIAFRYASAWS